MKFFIKILSISLLFNSCKSNDSKNYAGVVGVSMLSLQNEFVVNLKDEMEDRAKDKNLNLIITDAQRSAEKQVQQIETFISQRVDAIILNPCELEASSPAIERANAAGIPIINVNSETRLEPDAFVGSRDEEAGEIAMEYIAKQINYKGNLLIMHGYMGQAAQIKRAAGAKKVLNKYPNLKILAQQTAEWDREKAMKLMENWIQSYGNSINAVFAHNDEMGMGALQALEQANIKQRVTLVSIDAISDALRAVKDGRLNATIYQDAKGQAQGAIEMAVKMIGKEEITQSKIFVPFQLVTIENVSEFLNK
jgi:inositol transport system substrate-binding protein